MNEPELEIIGLALSYEKLIPDIISMDETVFTGDFSKACFRAVRDVYNCGESLDEYSLISRLLDEVPKPSDEIVDMVASLIVTAGEANTYETVKSYLYKSKYKRDFKRAIEDAALKLEKTGDIKSTGDYLLSNIITLSEKMNLKSGMISIKESSRMLFERMEQISEGKVQRTFTGIKKLDSYLGGIESPDVVYIAGRPSMGKTSLATKFLNYIAKGDPGGDNLIFTLETSDIRIAEKIHIQRTKIPQHKFINCNLDQKDWDRLTHSAVELSDHNNIYSFSRADIGANDMLAECVKHEAKNKVNSFFVDYLQLFKSPKNQWSREREVAEQSRIMKVAAKRLNCPGFVLSQLNRSLENRSDKVPGMSDLRDSGAIEQDADVILFIYRDEVYNPKDSTEKGIARIIIGKNKRGPTGYVKVGFDGATSNFYDI